MCLVGKIPYSVGIDTWAVDFVLLDENDNVSGMQWHTGTDGRKDMDRKGI